MKRSNESRSYQLDRQIDALSRMRDREIELGILNPDGSYKRKEVKRDLTQWEGVALEDIPASQARRILAEMKQGKVDGQEIVRKGINGKIRIRSLNEGGSGSRYTD